MFNMSVVEGCMCVCWCLRTNIWQNVRYSLAVRFSLLVLEISSFSCGNGQTWLTERHTHRMCVRERGIKRETFDYRHEIGPWRETEKKGE